MIRAPAIPRRFFRDRSGNTAVEFAMILPIFLAVVFGMIEFGRLLWIRNTMEYAAETAARWGGVNTSKTNAEIAAYATGKLIGVDTTGITFTANASSSNVSVTGTHTYSIITSSVFVTIPTITQSVTVQFPR